MKNLLKITSALMLVFCANADEYRPPLYKWKNSDVNPKAQAAREKSFSEFQENQYKVQESPYKNRDLASESEEMDNSDDGRNPSSTPNPRPANAPTYWPYNNK